MEECNATPWCSVQVCCKVSQEFTAQVEQERALGQQSLRLVQLEEITNSFSSHQNQKFTYRGAGFESNWRWPHPELYLAESPLRY
eukprot:3856542-Amphidinium_carterae.1